MRSRRGTSGSSHEGTVSSPLPDGNSPTRYRAFLSYSHAADGKVAPAVQAALHRLAKPWHRLRAIRVFRDKTSLSASHALWPSIEKALRDSEWPLLMASPEAAASLWVQWEVDWRRPLRAARRDRSCGRRQGHRLAFCATSHAPRDDHLTATRASAEACIGSWFVDLSAGGFESQSQGKRRSRQEPDNGPIVCTDGHKETEEPRAIHSAPCAHSHNSSPPTPPVNPALKSLSPWGKRR